MGFFYCVCFCKKEIQARADETDKLIKKFYEELKANSVDKVKFIYEVFELLIDYGCSQCPSIWTRM